MYDYKTGNISFPKWYLRKIDDNLVTNEDIQSIDNLWGENKMWNSNRVVKNIIGKDMYSSNASERSTAKVKAMNAILRLSATQGGTVTAKEARQKIPVVNELHKHEVALARERGYGSPMHSAANKLIYELTQSGQLTATNELRNGSTVFELNRNV